MKYKRLTNEELQALEKEFVNYLAAAQITAGDWENMKKNEIEKAEELIDVFSDMVYEKVTGKINFLEYRDKKTLNIYNCNQEGIVLIGLKVSENRRLDLTAADVLSQWNNNHDNAISIIKSEKKYVKDRGVEVFELLQSGCFITDDKLFNVLVTISK
jgi:hypothetical protein